MAHDSDDWKVQSHGTNLWLACDHHMADRNRERKAGFCREREKGRKRKKIFLLPLFVPLNQQMIVWCPLPSKTRSSSLSPITHISITKRWYSSFCFELSKVLAHIEGLTTSQSHYIGDHIATHEPLGNKPLSKL